MAYQHTTLATLRQRLQDRWESVPFWSDTEALWMLNEALRKWNLYTAQWKATVTFTTTPDQVWYSVGDYNFRHGLINYWRMEDVSGTADRVDSVDALPLTPNTAVTQVIGKRNFACQVPFGGTLTAAAGVNWISPWSQSTWFTFDTDASAVDPLTATSFNLVLAKTASTALNPSVLNLITPTTSFVGTRKLLAGNYYHLVMTYDGAGQYFVYLNGTLELNAHETTPPVSGGLQIIAPQVVAGTATFDEVARYNIALSPAQARTLYNNGDGLFIDSIGGTLIYPLRMEFQSYPMNACSIEDMDSFRVYWQNEYVGWGRTTPVRPQLYIPAGLTMFGIWPQDHVGGSTIAVDGVLKTPQLLSDSDFVDIGEEELHVLLGEALAIGTFKEGGARWKASQRFHQEFLQGAMAKNGRLKSSFHFRKYAGLDTAWSSKPMKVPVGAQNG